MTFKRELIYQDRLVAFVDILGFKDAVNKSAGADEWCIKLRKKINRLVDNNESFQLYNDAFKVLYEEQLKGKAEETAEIKFFSDCIVFSSEVAKNINDNIVTIFLKFIMNLAIETANFGFLLRGGITFGKIRHDHNKCFGPAMNRAYLLESETAVYPRILIDGFALKELAKDKFIHNSIEFISPDKSDGLLFLDYLSQKAYFEENDNYYDFDRNRLDYNQFLKNTKKLITNSLEQYNNNEKVLEKYQWYKEYYNDTIKKVLCQEQQDEFLIK